MPRIKPHRKQLYRPFIDALRSVALAIFICAAGVTTAHATPFTTTVPGTSVQIPASYPEAGGIVLVLFGASGNIYFQFSNPSTMMRGFQDRNTTTPQAFRGSPTWQLAPTYTADCGINTCDDYFGGDVVSGYVRFSASDGDTSPTGSGNFDLNDITLVLNGQNVGNWSDPATETTNVTGTIASANRIGFPNGAYNTGWFPITNQTLLDSFLTPNQTVTWEATDADPNDNFWDFTIGNDADVSEVPIRVAPGLEFEKTALTANFQNVGATLSYSYVLENIGTVYIDAISIADDKIPTVTCPQPRLDPGESMTCTGSYQTTQQDLDAGGVTNIATVTGTPQAATLGPITDDAFVPAIAQTSSLSLAKSPPTNNDADASGGVSLGDQLTYTITATNNGTVTQTTVLVQDALLTPSSNTCGAVPPGGSCVLNGTYNVTQNDVDSGSITNTASVTSDLVTTPVVASVTTPVVQSSALGFDKRALTPTYSAAGTTLNYEYEVTNLGTVTITQPISVSDDKIASVSCPALPAGGLAPNTSIICTATYSTLQQDVDTGSITNTATASSGALTSPPDNATVNATQTPALTLTKTASPATYAAIGDTIAYSYQVTNSGNTTLTSAITITDDQVSVTCPALPAGGLAPGANIVCTAQDTIDQADLDNGSLTNTATAASGLTQSAPVSETVNATQTQAITLTKTATPTTFDTLGQTISYDYVVTNNGNVTLTSVVAITDDRIPSISCPMLPPAGLAPGASLTCTGQDSVTQADLDAGEIVNTASATSGSTTSPDVVETVTADLLPELTLTKSADASAVSSPAQPGETVVFSIMVKNTGNVSLSAITVSDPLLGGDITADCVFPTTSGVLAPDEMATCTSSYSITQSDIDAGEVENTATAQGQDPAGSTASDSNDDPVITPLTQEPQMSVDKNATDVNFALPGDIVTYEYIVTNTGNTTITAPVTVTDNLISAVSCPALPAGGLLPGNTLTCNATYSVTQADLDAGTVTNLASASDGTTTSPIASETIPADQSPGLDIEKTSPDTSYSVAGQTLTYNFVVNNTGNLTLTGDIDITDSRIGTFTCFSGNLVPGASATCQRTDTVTLADLNSGSVTNQAFATNGGLTTPPVDVTINASQLPALTLEKRALNTSYAAPGDQINYEYTIENTGNVTISALSLVDDQIGAISCPQTTLAPSASTICTATDTMTQSDIDNGSLTNNATLSGTPAGGSLAPVTDSATVTANQTPSLAFTKTAQNASYASVGDTLQYQYRVENDGNVIINNIAISDNRISPVTCPQTTLQPGEFMVCTGTDVVSQTDIDNGSVANTATVSGTPTGGTLDPETVTESVNATQTRSIAMAKSADLSQFDAPGTTITYTFVVTNTGNVTLTDPISITDDRLGLVSCPPLPAGGLAPLATHTCTGSDVTTQADVDAGLVTNTASALAGGLASSPVSETVPADQQPELTVLKSAVTADYDAAGDFIDYTYLVTNSGNTTLQGTLTVTDNLISNIVCPGVNAMGLAPGASVTCTARYWVTQADVDAGQVTNSASADLGGVTSPTVNETVDAVQNPALTMTKSANPTVVDTLGTSITYTYTVTNAGNTTITAPIVISDDRITSVTCPALPPTGLAPGATLQCSATDTVDQDDLDAGSITNTATATSGAVSSPPVSETVVVDQTSSMAVDKRAITVNFTLPGDISTYEYEVTNTGNVSITAPITVSDSLIPVVSCPPLPAGGLAPGASIVCTGSYASTQADLDQGAVTNTATATDGTTTSPPVDETIPANAQPSIRIVKTALDTDFSMPGDTLTYEFLVRNNGNITLTGNTEVVDDKLGTIVCFTGNLVPAATTTCQATYTVTQDDVDEGFVTNYAFARNGSVSSDVVDVTVTGTQSPSITMVKNALTPQFAAPGDQLDYEYVVTNSGNTTVMFPIEVTDDRISNVICPALPAGGLLPGASLTCTGSDTVTQADIDFGVVNNTATASDGVTTSPPQTASVDADQTRELSLQKTALNTSYAVAGDLLNYDYLLTNTGNTTLLGVVSVTDDRIANVACPPLPAGGLVPNAQLNCSGQEIVTQAMLDTGSVTNNATGSVGSTTSPPASATVGADSEPALLVTKSVDGSALSDPVIAGDTLTYLIRVQNTGNVTLTGVSVNDPLLGGNVTASCSFSGTAGQLDVGDFVDCSGSYTITQADVDAGGVANSAQASGSDPQGSTVTDTSDAGNESAESPALDGSVDGDPTNDPTVIFFGPAPSLSVAKRALTNGFNAIGDQLDYEYDVTNTGNVTLFDPITVSDDRIASVICPALPASGFAPGQTVTCTGSDVVSQADLDAGTVTNTATAGSGDVTSPPVTVTVAAVQDAQLVVEKTVSSLQNISGSLFEATYQLVLRNTGNVTLTGLSLSDNLANALSPAMIAATPTVSMAGFSGTGGQNPAYDGNAVTAIFVGDVRLAVGAEGIVTLVVRLDISTGTPAGGNTALGGSNETSAPVPSNDPGVTPGDDGDTNPTPLELQDSDGDGVPDGTESDTQDRDGDGIVDSEDYDPTGYFYCEEDGAILSGGSISVSGPAGTNASVGTANNITIVHDGSNGFYQFYVSAPGQYVISPTYPVTGEPSTSRLVTSTALDVTSALPANPALLGSTETGATGRLADESLSANPAFYFSFDIEAGDPAVFANNIPLQACGTPAVALTKTVLTEPERQDDGRVAMSYELVATNSGQTRIENVVVSDDLAAVFGPGTLEVTDTQLTTAPAGFTASLNPAFDGEQNIDLLQTGGTLLAGEAVTLEISLAVAIDEAGDYENTADVTADPPLLDNPALVAPNNGEPVTDSASATVTVANISDPSQLIVTKTARPTVVQLGDLVRYRVSIENSSDSAMTDLQIFDRPPAGLQFVENSSRFTLEDGSEVSLEPTSTTGQIGWRLNDAPELAILDGGATMILDYSMVAGPSTAFGELTNAAWVADTLTGATSSIANAVIEYLPEPTFDCTPVIGRVFDDLNANGYFDEGEPGVPAARLNTVNGDIIATDEHGRYHIPCAAIPDAQRGANFVLKLDRRSLPLDAQITTENPGVVRATRGKLIKLNFGAQLPTSDLPVGDPAAAADSSSSERSSAHNTRKGAPGEVRTAGETAGAHRVFTTVDALHIEKRLSLSSDASYNDAGELRLEARGFWNYPHWVTQAEVRLFEAETSPRSKPLAIAELDQDGLVDLPLDDNSDTDFAIVLRVYDDKGRFDETSPRLVRRPDRETAQQAEVASELPTGDDAELMDAYGANALTLDNIPVNGATVRVYGHTTPGGRIASMGQAVGADPEGAFLLEAILPDGKQQITLDVAGTTQTRDIDVETRDIQGVGQFEVTLGRSRTAAEDVNVDGRAAFYVRGRLNPDVRITATADTGEAGISNLFKQLDEKDARSLLRRLDPDRYYPVYGDDSTITEDAPTSGRFYLRLEHEDDYALWGNYRTNFNDTEFARLERTLYGAKLHWDGGGLPTSLGESRATVDAFLADPGTRSARDEIRGTGGSVYFLRNGDLSIGSDIVRVEVKDQLSGIVQSSRPLAYGDDYDIDYLQGRIILNEPLNAFAEDGRLFQNGNLSGNEVYLVVEYEFTQGLDNFDQLAFGARATRWLGDALKIGATYTRDIQAGAETNVTGADIRWQWSAEGYLRAELAVTEGAGLSTFRSVDGGLSYSQVPVAGARKNPMGILIEGAADLTDLGLADGRGSFYYRKREAGFAGFGQLIDDDTTQFGMALTSNLSDSLDLQMRADLVESDLSGNRALAEATLTKSVNDALSVEAGINYQDDFLVDGATAIGLKINYQFDETNRLYVFGQNALSDADGAQVLNRYGIGGELKVHEKLSAGAEISDGDAGVSSQVKLSYKRDEHSQTYLTYDLPTRSNSGQRAGGYGQNVDGGLTLGARQRLTDGVSVFGEERHRFGSAETGLAGTTRAFGVDYTPFESWTLGLSSEIGDVGPFERESFSFSGGYREGKVRAGMTVEYREDENRDTDELLEALLFRMDANAQFTDSLRMQLKLNHADVEGSGSIGQASYQAAEFTEASFGLAYRPIAHDRLNVLAKAVYLADLSPAGQRVNGDLLDYRQESLIYSLDTNYEISQACSIGGKVGYRRGKVTEGRDSNDFFASKARLLVGRLDCNIVNKWDVLVEGRQLQYGVDDIEQWGGLFGVYRQVGDNVRFGGGLNIGGIDNDYLGLQRDRDIGWFLNAVTTF